MVTEGDDEKRGALCSANHVEVHGDEVRLSLWHPQWGGYCSHALATFGTTTSNTEGRPGCFEVSNFHDGEFPCATPTNYHYCDATQLVRFGIAILEAQMKYQKAADGAPVRIEHELLDGLIDKLRALKVPR